MSALDHQPSWSRLFHLACDLIRQVNADTLVIDRWTFGGGTALMLQIDHRESRDVDIFLQDPQLLGFIDPQKQDFQFEIEPSAQHSDGSGFLKLAFKDVGEIDFIVSQPKTSKPAARRDIEGESVLLETIPEIIAKKVVHRGSLIRPRDIFDIAAAGERHADSIAAELRRYGAEVSRTLETLERLNPEFVNNAISQLVIRREFSDVAGTAIQRTKQVLQTALRPIRGS